MIQCVHCGELFKPLARNNKQVYCQKPECRTAKYEDKKSKQRRHTFNLCNHCGRVFRIVRGGQKWCPHPLCQKDRREYQLQYMSKYGKAKRKEKNQQKLRPKPEPPKVKTPERICQYCHKPIGQKDFENGFRITHSKCRPAWLASRDIDGCYDYPVWLDYGRMEEA